MDPEKLIPILEQDVFALTDRGSHELRGASTALAPRELGLLVLIDGKATVEQLMRRAPQIAREAILDSLRGMLQAQLIRPAGEQAKSDSLDFTDFLNAKTVPLSAGALAQASAEAAAGEATLKQNGYFVRIARRAPTERRLAQGQKLSVIMIEDEPYLSKLLKQYLTLEGFEPRAATNRAEILAEFRRPPRPDLVLLDIMLPDTDGFDVLVTMRNHPALKAVPVIMLTAKATRESVLRGLACGADGYITKPFEVDVLLKAVKAVLGLPE